MSVDGFQGREKEAVIISLVRYHGGQQTDRQMSYGECCQPIQVKTNSCTNDKHRLIRSFQQIQRESRSWLFVRESTFERGRDAGETPSDGSLRLDHRFQSRLHPIARRPRPQSWQRHLRARVDRPRSRQRRRLDRKWWGQRRLQG